jgi:hypothetical protein
MNLLSLCLNEGKQRNLSFSDVHFIFPNTNDKETKFKFLKISNKA